MDSTDGHGYGKYSHGCRCKTCREAKTEYMRKRRADARLLAQAHTSWAVKGGAWGNGAVRFLAPVERHGTRFAYEERGCRCGDCTEARTSADARYTQLKEES